MSRKRQLFKVIQKTFRQISKQFLSAINKQIIWLLRTIFGTPRRRSSVNAGFILPTVAMVTLVVVLLTTAILFRSFERSKNASNVRVNEAVLNAATPAIDRARAKIETLLQDPTLPRGTPSDTALYEAIKKDKYRLGDETRLKLGFELPLNPDGTPNTAGIQNPTSTTPIEYDETLKTAWKYGVDTDNNGKKDTFTLYGIYFRTPPRDSTGGFSRERKALEARTPPMDGSSNPGCVGASGFASLVGNSSWYKLNSGNLGKSFFVYTVNVPITKQIYDGLPNNTTASINQNNSEEYKGNKSVAALEFQQDRTRIPLSNNAIWFENDLEVIVGSTTLLLNGRIHTNSNLLVGVINSGGNITLRQVSSKTSCFYNQENGQITVGGNVGNGSLAQNNTGTDVTVDLYQGPGNITTSSINDTNKSTNKSGGAEIGFNDAAFNKRIAAMKTTASGLCTTCYAAATTTGTALKAAVKASGYPSDVITNVTAKVQNNDDGDTAKNILSDEIEIYLRNRTRRVPFVEEPDATGGDQTTSYTAITASLDPQATWREPVNTSNQFTGATGTNLSTSQLEGTYPDLQKKEGVQTKLADRVFVGNNLPALWLQGSQYVNSEANQLITSSAGVAVNWTRPTGADAQQRWRNTQIQAVTDLGLSDRNGFWEENAAANPINDLDSIGGVRIVTGAGIYVDGPGSTVNTTTGPFYPRGLGSFLTAYSTDNTIVWPDTMPMSSPKASETRKGDLLMRATAVYHYKVDYGTDQEPIACVSSYYDPSDRNTIKNKVNKDGGYGVDTTNGRSNNGIVYAFPGRSTFTANKTLLQLQANLKFPNGRLANQPLKDALTKIATGTTVPSTGLQLADYSAVDTALCAISILSNETNFVTTLTNLPAHGAIKEASFLDAREAKQISKPSTPNVSSTYDLDLEQRQPLEVRVTEIDLASLASTVIATTEYLLPYSGIIYASRDDALRDATEPYVANDIKSISNSELLSPTDFKLDPTRRPNGIRLINGETLARNGSTGNNVYNAKEKGLILVTNLPVYIKGKFNLHQATVGSGAEIEEFTEKEPATNFYDRSTANTKFACRINRKPTCSDTIGQGDFWRPATILADSITLLSGSSPTVGFKDGVRSEGDYDLNNNTGVIFDPANPNTNLLKNGFAENNFVTSTDWWQPSGGDKNYPKTSLGSYTMNGVTPIQRRVDNTSMYVMEMCRKLPVSECQSSDWVVGFDVDGNGVLSTTLQNYTVGANTVSLIERDIKGYQLGQALAFSPTYSASVLTNWDTPFGTSPNNKSIRQRLGAGDTATQALESADRSYPRRVAFARYGNGVTGRINNELVATNATAPFLYRPLGIGCPLDTAATGTAATSYTYTNGCTYGGTTAGTNYGQTGSSALWFRTTTFSASNPAANESYGNGNSLFYYPLQVDANADGIIDPDGQPLVVPVLQIHESKDTSSIRGDATTQTEFRDKWIQQSTVDTTFNATFVLGNSPSRSAETSAGFQNLVRFLENWNSKVKISGSFIQLKRSSFSTGPISPIFAARATNSGNNATLTNNLSLFDYELDSYATPNGSGLLPFYNAPTRNWGFDVGLLSEQPDLFAQRFTLPPSGRPNEYFREVGRDDTWVKTLLCAGEASNQTGIPETAVLPATPVPVTYAYAVPSEYRPSECRSTSINIPND